MRRQKKATKPTSIRWPGSINQILEFWMKVHGLDRTHTACELIKYADALARKDKSLR